MAWLILIVIIVDTNVFQTGFYTQSNLN